MAGYRLISEARDELIAGVNFYDSEYHGSVKISLWKCDDSAG
jgi:hypothetical protein